MYYFMWFLKRTFRCTNVTGHFSGVIETSVEHKWLSRWPYMNSNPILPSKCRLMWSSVIGWDLWNCFWICMFFDMKINMVVSLKQLWNNSKTIPKRFGIVSVFYFTCKSVSNKTLFTVTLWNRADQYIFILWFLLSSFFSSPNLSSQRMDVCHTSTHAVASVQI